MIAAFEEFDRVQVTSATGSGKTIITSELMRLEEGRSLFLADGTELVLQNSDKYHKHTGDFAAVEMEKLKARPYERKVTIASAQTLHRRLEKYPADYFAKIIVDECFPAGTLVDGRPIESFKIGDEITAFDEVTGTLKQSRVTDVLCHVTHNPLVEVRVQGKRIRCTPNHPFWTQRGWVPAALVDSGDSVLTTETLEDLSLSSLPSLRNAVLTIEEPASQPEAQAKCGMVLLPGVSECALLRATESAKSDARPEGESDGFDQAKGDGLEANSQRRERETVASGAYSDCCDAGLENGSGDCHEIATPGTRTADLLQTGHCARGVEDCAGDRRKFPQRDCEERARCEKGRVLSWARVEGVESVEEGSATEPAGYRFARAVYNLTVSTYSTYLVQGVVVHNCHRNTLGGMAQKILKHFESAKVLGMTGSPKGPKGRSLSEYYQHIAHDVGLERLIREGWLARIVLKCIPLGVDLSHVGTASDGDYKLGELDEVVEPHLLKAAQILAHHGKGRKSVVFVPLVKTAYKFATACRAVGLKAVAVDGDDKSSLTHFTHGNADVIVNAALLTTGWDCDLVDCVMILRPTKSENLFRQMVGRGTRPRYMEGFDPNADMHNHELRREAMRLGPKANLLLIDPLFMTDDVKLIGAARLMARDGDLEAAIAKHLASMAPGEDNLFADVEAVDLLDADEKVEKDAAEIRELSLKKKLEAAANKKERTVDAVEFFLALHEKEFAEYTPEHDWEGEPPSEGQRKLLEKNGFDPDAIKYKGQAVAILELVATRRDAGLASPAQVKALRKLGHSNPDLATFDEAKKFIASAALRGWAPLVQKPEAKPNTPRVWRSVSGNTLEGVFVKLTKQGATLRLAGGRVMELPLERFVEDDRIALMHLAHEEQKSNPRPRYKFRV